MELSSKSLLYLLLIVAISVYTVESMQCYVCNSGINYQGKNCETNFVGFKEECGVDQNYTRCRKTIQTVVDDVRTIRSCATAGTQTGSKCVDRTGTFKVRVKYCECDHENCNGSSGVIAPILLVVVLALSNAFANAR